MQKYNKYRTYPNFSRQLTRVQLHILTYTTKRELSSELIISSFSNLPPILAFGTIYPQQGLRFAHHLPVVCQPFWLAFHFHQAIKKIGITELTELRPILARTRLPERKLNELQNEWWLTNTPQTNSYTLTYTPREIITTHGRISYENDNEKSPLHSFPLCERL